MAAKPPPYSPLRARPHYLRALNDEGEVEEVYEEYVELLEAGEDSAEAFDYAATCTPGPNSYMPTFWITGRFTDAVTVDVAEEAGPSSPNLLELDCIVVHN